MPSWDQARNLWVVRIVYDGPGLAGKTTNLKKITELVSAKRRSEMYTPAELKGRTMFFDWMEVKGPPVSNHEIRFQLITVPGQLERNYRRRPLVEMADVVVFVGDCAAMTDTMRTFARLRASMKRRKQPVPLVIQANKQDGDEALDPIQLKKKLKVAADVPVLAATAIDGKGVRETLATAMRIGLGTLSKAEILPETVTLFDGDTLFDHVLQFEDNANDKEPVDVEELFIGAEEVDVDGQAAIGHLTAASFDDLEARAKRAAAKQPEPEAAVVRKKGGAATTKKHRGS